LASGTDATRPIAEVAVKPQKRTGRFLIVDDEDPIRDLLAEMLVEQAVEHLSNHGSEADLLRAIAAFVTERDR